MGGLSVSNLVDVTVNINVPGASGRSFGTLCIAGDSNTINGLQRIRSYANLDGVGVDFSIGSPEYQAAELYFGQNPSPSSLMIGRWLAGATAALNDGGFLSPLQQTLSNWTTISSGGFIIHIDGVTVTLTGLDFTAVTNLNGVASVITAALSGGQTCTWNGFNFVITSGTTGAGAQATGTITFGAAGTANDTVTVNGTLITLVSGTPSGSQVKIGSTAAQTAANLQTFLQNSVDTNISAATYSTTLGVITVTYKLVGTAGNSFSLVKSSTAITLSGAVLAGGTVASSVGFATAGTGTDISAQLALTSALSQALVPGYAAETPAACAAALAAISTAWYGLMFASVNTITDNQNLAVSNFIEATGSGISRVFGVTTQEANALSSLSTTDLAYLMDHAGYNRSFCQYSSYTPYAVASFFGRAFTVDFSGNNTTINLMWKQEPGVTPETLTQSQALALKAKNCNVLAEYVNNTSIIQYGGMSSGFFFDVIQGTDWGKDAIQTACYNVLYTSPTKVPQTDAGVNQLTNAIAGVSQQAVTNGLVAPGTWNAAGFGSLTQGQYLKLGYYIYAQPIALQSEADRVTRNCPPITVAWQLAGGIQLVLNLLVNVNQ